MTSFLVVEAAELADDARRLLGEVEQAMPGAGGANGECRPALDVLETADSVEVVLDVPGVPAEAMRVAIRRQTVLVVGAKLPGVPHRDARFHVAERSYGRFARAVRVSEVIDASRARAVVADGQLRVILPRRQDRRGAAVSVPVTRG